MVKQGPMILKGGIKMKKGIILGIICLLVVIFVSGCTSNPDYPGIVITDFDVENHNFNPDTNEDGGNWTSVSSAIDNNGDVEYHNIVVVFDLYDGNGEIIKSINETLPLLKPGDSEFPIISFEEPQGVKESRCRIVSAEKV